MKRALAASAMLALLAAAPAANCEDVRYYEENGVTYRETRQVVQRPVTEVTHQPTDRTVLREQYRTEMHDTVQVYSAPVTEWRYEAYWVGRWNPFMQPYLAQRLVPYTRWETRTAKAQTPVVKREVVSEVRTEHVPVVTSRMVNEEVIRRVAVGGTPAGTPGQPTPQVAQQNTIGGVNRLDGTVRR